MINRFCFMETYYTYVCIHLTYFTSFSTGHCVPRYVPNRLTRGKTGLLHARAHFVRFEYIISNIHEYLIYTHVPGSSQDGIWHSTGNYLIIDSAEIHTKLFKSIPNLYSQVPRSRRNLRRNLWSYLSHADPPYLMMSSSEHPSH